MRLRLGIGALAALLAPVALFALDPSRTLTQYVHRIWQVQQGLPEASIYSLIQTRDGYLWLGTQSGLVRFDGVKFTTLDSIHASAPVNTWIRATAEDAQGRLWFGTNESGLYRLAGSSITHYSTKEGLPSDTIQFLAAIKDEVWAGTPAGLVRISLDKSGEKITHYSTADGLSSNDVRAIAGAADGKIWIATDSPSLNSWDGSRFEAHPLSTIPSDAGARSLAFSKDGSLWAGTTVGLVELKDGVEHLITVAQGLADNWVLSLAAAPDGALWIGTRNGFSRLLKSGGANEIVSFHPKDGLSQSTVFSVYEDREGSLWVGTKHGLNQFLDGRAIPYTVNEGLPTNETGPVVKDKRGDMWIGTLGAGLTRYDGRHFTLLNSSNGLASNFVNALAEDADGTLWIGTTRGLNRLRDGRIDQTITTAQGLPANEIHGLLADSSGTLWIGTSAGAVALKNGKVSRIPGLDLRDPVLSIGEDASHRIYFATANNVYSWAAGSSEELLQNGAPLRGADSFYPDRDGNLWIGTLSGGLRLLRNGKLSVFQMRDGLFDAEIYGIAADDQDRLWMACSKGIFWVARQDLLRFASGELKKLTSYPYSPTDALRVIECKAGVQPAAALAGDGRVWFSTIRGMIVLDSKHLQRGTAAAPIVVEDVTVNGEQIAPSEIGALAPGRKNLEFRYTGLTFFAPTRLTFRYMMEGYDKDWINAGTRREAYYTNLPPGTNFRFRVVGCNLDGACNEAGTVVFSLASHYYQRVWFWPMVAVAIAISIWLAYQLRMRQLREHFNVIITERNRIARELHDTLIQGLSGITMEMQALAGRMSVPDERNTMGDIIEDAGNCLRETRRSVAGLRSGQSGAGLATAIEQAAKQITETKSIKLKLRLGRNGKGLPADVEYNLVRIAQEAVSNSVKHSGARTVEVALDYSPKAVHLSVRDDGTGFARAENGPGRPGHYGLIGMKERATHIGAEFELASAPGRGTMISVTLPAGSNGGHVGHNGGQNGSTQ